MSCSVCKLTADFAEYLLEINYLAFAASISKLMKLIKRLLYYLDGRLRFLVFYDKRFRGSSLTKEGRSVVSQMSTLLDKPI